MAGERRGQPAAALVGLAPGLAVGAVHHGKPIRIDIGSAFDEPKRRQGGIIGAILIEAGEIGWIAGHDVSSVGRLGIDLRPKLARCLE
jgi:hypothetical protein